MSAPVENALRACLALCDHDGHRVDITIGGGRVRVYVMDRNGRTCSRAESDWREDKDVNAETVNAIAKAMAAHREHAS